MTDDLPQGESIPAKRRTRGPSLAKTARTRETIVAAAMREFLENGFSGTTMASVARRAGLAKGTTYLYFATKEALFAGVVTDVITNVLGEAERQQIEPGEKVGAYFRRTLLPVMRQIELTGRASVARLVIAEGKQFPFLVEVYRKQVFEPLLDHIHTYARLAHARGELVNDSLVRYPHLLMGPLWAGMITNGMIMPDKPVDIGNMFEAFIDMAFPG